MLLVHVSGQNMGKCGVPDAEYKAFDHKIDKMNYLDLLTYHNPAEVSLLPSTIYARWPDRTGI